MKKYAELIARVGANIKKGQPVRLVISADQYEFATLLVKEGDKVAIEDLLIEFE